MISLKRTKEEIKEETTYEPSPLDEDYGWGTRMHLDPSQVKSLGLTDLAAGQEVNVGGKAVIRSINSHDDGNGLKTSVSLQFTDMETNKPSTESERADALYGKK